MSRSPERTLRVFSRPGCHLCEEFIEVLMPLAGARLPLEVVDISGNEALEAEYGTRIPVLEVDGRVICEYRLDRDAVAALLAESAAPPS